MKTNRVIATAVLSAFLVAGLPPAVRADPAPGALRASIDRAVAQLDHQPTGPKPTTQRSTSKAMQPGYGGGGGGKGMMIMSLVSTVVGLAATYYVIKQVQEQQKQTGQ